VRLVGYLKRKRSRCSDSLRAGRFWFRNPVGKRRFLLSIPAHTDPGAHPTASKMANRGSVPGVKRPGLALTTDLHLVPRWKKSRAMPLLPLCACIACYRHSRLSSLRNLNFPQHWCWRFKSSSCGYRNTMAISFVGPLRMMEMGYNSQIISLSEGFSNENDGTTSVLLT
jgi:hypothetical protein